MLKRARSRSLLALSAKAILSPEADWDASVCVGSTDVDCVESGLPVQTGKPILKDGINNFSIYLPSFWQRWHYWATHSRLAPLIEKTKLIARHLPSILTYLFAEVRLSALPLCRKRLSRYYVYR